MKKNIKLYILVTLLGIIFIFALRFYTSSAYQSGFDKSSVKGKILIRRRGSNFYLMNAIHGGKGFYLLNANGTNIRKVNIIRHPILSLQAKKVAWIVYKDSDIFEEINILSVNSIFSS